ncbi:MAG: Flp family type IVb pilin [Dehalococcoidia bacterium]|jgi:pilus assembly protein Flp/PilA
MQFINESILRLYCWMKEEKAQTMAEYGLILALVSVAAVIVLGTMGTKIGSVFTSITNSL